jgi:DNA-directed RNA polymerase subunit RPC12/RpoP
MSEEIKSNVVFLELIQKQQLSLKKSNRRDTKWSNNPQCQHLIIEVDEEENEVVCEDCGIRLNPVAILWRFAGEESRLFNEMQQRKAHIIEMAKRIDAKNRCKCQHCGKMTKIEK